MVAISAVYEILDGRSTRRHECSQSRALVIAGLDQMGVGSLQLAQSRHHVSGEGNFTDPASRCEIHRQALSVAAELEDRPQAKHDEESG